jgi:hypothetical protein
VDEDDDVVDPQCLEEEPTPVASLCCCCCCRGFFTRRSLPPPPLTDARRLHGSAAGVCSGLCSMTRLGLASRSLQMEAELHPSVCLLFFL